MGVPVITLAGKVHAGRVGVSQLKAIGLDMLIAESPDQYAQIASGLAADPDHLKMLRTTMRQRMAASPLMDAAGFTRNLEASYRTIWHDWCDS
jgi:predicted O-linked N-acetylglucosamine transferase (SPINDLY family)